MWIFCYIPHWSKIIFSETVDDRHPSLVLSFLLVCGRVRELFDVILSDYCFERRGYF